jgi:hypothetical protein
MCLLREKESTKGGGSLVLLWRCQRRTATQISMGVISGQTLIKRAARDILGERACVSAGAATLLMHEQEQEQDSDPENVQFST